MLKIFLNDSTRYGTKILLDLLIFASQGFFLIVTELIKKNKTRSVAQQQVGSLFCLLIP